MYRFLLFLFPVLLLSACLNVPEFPDEPVLTYVGISKDTILQFNAQMQVQDSLTIQFSFTDGDGDLSIVEDSISDILLFDSRLDTVPIPLSLPIITGGNTSNGISGDIFIRIVNENAAICCIRERGNTGFRDVCFSSPDFPLDTFSYRIQLLDRAGNISNIIRTETINIRCIPE